ncbi:unnamed protein product [Acanthoscelides obtectus]|uniref:DDE Tnp4 domain-containing protein n=1 Tax=Acanthoscelides obtectus TaxID=200917 RepID=A0A9P0JQ28_ACAOB|nr:unnamed protein product [Acanthoscelides obtectus]CAK1625798.1 hypothetical protein AOBTE_LOCUS3405 [Acanthoscelides obtectus]
MDSLSRINIIEILESSETDMSDIEDIPRERIVRTRRLPLIELDDLEFERRFRINKNTYRRLETVLQNVTEPINERNQPISKENQILMWGLKVETMCEVIVATAVLHNMCLEQNDTIDFFLRMDLKCNKLKRSRSELDLKILQQETQ